MIKFWKRQRSPAPSATAAEETDSPDPANSPADPQAAAAKPARAGCWGWLTAGAAGSSGMDSAGPGGGLDDGGGGE